MRISVFGLGYVGAVNCGCLVELGHDVIGVDVDEDKVRQISRGESPVSEPGLDGLIGKAVECGRLRAVNDPTDAVVATDMAMLCVGTPSTQSGGINAEFLERVTQEIGAALRGDKKPFFAVLTRSTASTEVHNQLMEILVTASGRELGKGVGYACHPEFLREGAAVEDFLHPPKIVFGPTDRRTESLCSTLYPGIAAPTFILDAGEAAMVKYADNCFHALKVTFANEIGLVCREAGIDAITVMDVMCQDTKLNLSPKYLRPGAPFGGSCLPKDVRAILDFARLTASPIPMLSGILKSNALQVQALTERITNGARPKVGMVGLAFKEQTDDVRESPLVEIVERLTGKGLQVLVYDDQLVPDRLTGANKSWALAKIPHVTDMLRNDLQEVIDHADIVVVGHRLRPGRWEAIRLRSDQRILDLAMVPELRSHPGYEGVYW